jgi:hypothetical protein
MNFNRFHVLLILPFCIYAIFAIYFLYHSLTAAWLWSRARQGNKAAESHPFERALPAPDYTYQIHLKKALRAFAVFVILFAVIWLGMVLAVIARG